MFNLADLSLLLCLLAIVFGFWQWRLQDETARQYAEHICQRHQLQLLDIARKSGGLSWRHQLGWRATFQFGFSSDGETRYEGSLTLLNLHLQNSQLPPYRVESTDDDVERVLH